MIIPKGIRCFIIRYCRGDKTFITQLQTQTTIDIDTNMLYDERCDETTARGGHFDKDFKKHLPSVGRFVVYSHPPINDNSRDKNDIWYLGIYK